MRLVAAVISIVACLSHLGSLSLGEMVKGKMVDVFRRKRPVFRLKTWLYYVYVEQLLVQVSLSRGHLIMEYWFEILHQEN